MTSTKTAAELPADDPWTEPLHATAPPRPSTAKPWIPRKQLSKASRRMNGQT